MAPRRVVVLRPDNLGDLVLFSGALRHLRARFPGAEITLVAQRFARNLLEDCPHVDRLVDRDRLLWPLRSRLRSFRGRDRLDRWTVEAVSRLRPAPDLVIVPVRSPSPLVHRAVELLRGRRTVGISGDPSNQTPEQDAAAGRLYDQRMHLPPARRWHPELTITREFLDFLGVSTSSESIAPEFWTRPDDVAWARDRMERVAGSRLLALAPGVTSRSGKFYAGDGIRQALDGVEGERFSVHLFGAPAEAEMNAQVARELRGAPSVVLVRDHTGTSTVRQLVEALRRCDLVVSQETGALHIATALGIPTVGIVGGGHFGRFYPWGDPERNRVARKPMECYHCNWQCRFETIRCIQEIPPAQISTEIAAALQAGRIAGRTAGPPEG